MTAAVKLEGQKFGMLLVLCREGSKTYNSAEGKPRCVFSTWLCQCDCGEQRVVTSRALLSKGCWNCGCSRKPGKLSKYSRGTGFGLLYNNYIKNAGKRGVPFELTQDEFHELINANCYYTGRPPSRSRSFP